MGQTQSIPGIEGKQGPIGPQGIKGDLGPMGPKGDIGPKGDAGGAQGPAGRTGDKGDTGPAGKDGINGKDAVIDPNNFMYFANGTLGTIGESPVGIFLSSKSSTNLSESKSEISNDAALRALALYGNSSSGSKQVNLYDNVLVNKKLTVNEGINLGNGVNISSNTTGDLIITVNGNTWTLTKNGDTNFPGSIVSNKGVTATGIKNNGSYSQASVGDFAIDAPNVPGGRLKMTEAGTLQLGNINKGNVWNINPGPDLDIFTKSHDSILIDKARYIIAGNYTNGVNKWIKGSSGYS